MHISSVVEAQTRSLGALYNQFEITVVLCVYKIAPKNGIHDGT